MRISLNIRRITALAAAALALGLGAFLAAPAQAAGAAPLTAATQKASAVPPADSIVCDTIVSRGNTIALCSTGTYYDGGNPYRWPVTQLNTSLAANRVWFHQNHDGTGWAKCYSGGRSYNIAAAYQDPGNIFISTNTAPC
jgi:hypothetical protein